MRGKENARMSWRGDDVRLRITQRAPAKSARSSSSCDTCRRPACRVARPAGLHMGSVHLSELALDRLRGASCQPCMTLCPSPAFRELLLIICLLINHAYALAIVCQSAFVFISCLHLFYELITACFSEMGKASYLSSEMKFSQKRGLFKIDN